MIMCGDDPFKRGDERMNDLSNGFGQKGIINIRQYGYSAGFNGFRNVQYTIFRASFTRNKKIARSNKLGIGANTCDFKFLRAFNHS